MSKNRVSIKRVYESPSADDGTRILVDRLWPRGLSKEAAKIDLWLKEIAPTTALRKWFAHDPAKWAEFQKSYAEELRDNKEQFAILKDEASKNIVTLLYAAKDELHNEAVVLKTLLQK